MGPPRARGRRIVWRDRTQRIATDSIFNSQNNFKRAFAFPRRDAPESCMNLSPNRGRAECRVPAAPAASCAKCGNAHECRHHRSTGTPGIPARNGFTAYLVLSPATNASCHRHQPFQDCSSTAGPTCLRQLDTSNGCQDHTALPSAAIVVRLRAVDRSRAFRQPALRSRRAPDAAASTASHPASVTIASAPLGDETARGLELIWVKREWKYFWKQDWTQAKSPDRAVSTSRRLAHKFVDEAAEHVSDSRAVLMTWDIQYAR